MPNKNFGIEIKTISLLMRIRLLFKKKIMNIDVMGDKYYYMICKWHKGKMYVLETGTVSTLDKSL